MNVRPATLGGLSCQVLDALPAGTTPGLVGVFCHGFGAPGTDLVPLGAELLHRSSPLADRLQLVFPAAPLSLDALGMFGGRAWWHLDLEQLTAALQHGHFRDQRNELPEGLPESRRMLMALLDQLTRETGVPRSRMVLGGFSQGSILATDVTFHSDQAPAALCILSGTLICETQWRELAARRRGLRVLQSHGRRDPLLSFQLAVSLKELLEEAGLEVEFLEFNGEHTIPAEALPRLVQLFEDALETPPTG